MSRCVAILRAFLKISNGYPFILCFDLLLFDALEYLLNECIKSFVFKANDFHVGFTYI